MASCNDCKFGTVKDGPIIMCRRFPAIAKVSPAHWCGEHVELVVTRAREPKPTAPDVGGLGAGRRPAAKN